MSSKMINAIKVQRLIVLFIVAGFFVHEGNGGRVKLLEPYKGKTSLRSRIRGDVAEVVHKESSKRRRLQTALYCVAVSGASDSALQTALDWACGSGTGQGNVDCSAIQESGSCYSPNTVANHASYAFDYYYVNQNGASEACNFSGLATTTSTNPSSGTCVYPSLGSTTTTSNSTTISPSTTLGPTSSYTNTNTTFGSPTTGSPSSSIILSSSWVNLVYTLLLSSFLCYAL